MSGINKVILIGNLGQDPVINNSVAKVSIATSESWRDKQTGESNEKTEWHKVVFFNRLAEIVAQYLNKGSKVYIEGSLRTSKYTDKEGIDRYSTEIIANKLEMLDSNKNNTTNHMLGLAPAKDNNLKEINFMDDDLPF